MSLSMIESLRSRQLHPVSRLAIRFGIFAVLLSLSFLSRARAQALQPVSPIGFGSIAVGSSSTPLTLSFTATVTTTISSVITTEEGAQDKDFVLVSTTCIGTLIPSENCNVILQFSPLQIGLRRGALSIIDGSGAVSNRIFLNGVGLGPQIVFSPVTAVATSSFAALSPAGFKTSTSVYDGSGNLFFNDYQNGRILELSASSAASVVTSQVSTEHSSMAIDGAGVLYISSPTQATVQIIVPGVSNTALSTGSTVTLVSPSGVAIDGEGFLYIADSQTNKVARIAADGSSAAYLPLTGLTTPLSGPNGLAVDANNLYIADTGNGRIVAVSLTTGNATAVSASNAFVSNFGVAVDAAGNLIISNAGGSNIEELTPAGTVFAFSADLGNALASMPIGLALSTTGDLISSDADLGLVAITRSTGSITFPTATKVGSFDSTDGNKNLTVQNSGNLPIQFLATDPAFSSTAFASGPTNTCPVLQATSTPLAVGATCTYAVGFTPTVVGPNDGTLTVKGTAVGTGAAISAFSNLIGTGIVQADTLKVVASPATTTPGVPVSFTVTVLQGTTVVTNFTGTVTFTMTDPTGAFLSGTSYTFTTADAGVHTFAAPVGAQFNTPGTFTISAHFGTIVGISNNVVVAFPSKTSLASSVNPTPINQQTTLTATVSSTASAIVATGTITFMSGNVALGTCTLAAGQCSLPISFPTGGSFSLTAVYGGDTNFSASTSAPVTQVVNGVPPIATLTSSVNPSFVNQQTTLAATIAVAAGETTAGAPTGTVTFLSGTTSLGSAALVNGVAALQTAFSAVGSYSLTAVYSGDANFATASSPVLTQVVEDFSIAVATGTSPTESVLGGSPTTYTFTLTPIGGTIFPGTISFGLSGFPLGTVATFSPATLAPGTAGANVTLTVNPPAAAQARLDPGGRQLRPRTVAHYAPVVLALLVLPFAAFRRRRRPVALFLWLLLGASAVGLTGCLSDSSSGYYGNVPQTYTLTVSGASGTLTHSTTVTLTVQ